MPEALFCMWLKPTDSSSNGTTATEIRTPVPD